MIKIEEHREGLIKTEYALMKDSMVLPYVLNLQSKGLKQGVDYFVLGEGKYRQVHQIKGGYNEK